ncbi:MAG: hypothetical protein R3E12_14780 [Candidatus Eisenbacteria bacterium]
MEINSFASVLQVGAQTLRGELAMARGDVDAAVEGLREAVALQDQLAYDEPPSFHYPVRQSLGVALLAAARPAEAETVYRKDLEEYPENGWSLYGLEASLREQGRDQDAAATHERFETAWTWSDITLESSRF